MKKVTVLFLVFVLISCKDETTKSGLIQNFGEALGTTFNIQYESSEDFMAEFEDVFKRVNQSMSTYQKSSDISKINQGDTSVIVDTLFVNVLKTSQQIWKETNGIFDPTVGPLVNAYGFGPNKQLGSIDSTKIDSIRSFVGLDKISLTSENKIVKVDPRIFIDFNALAKGYTLDLLGDVLNKKGVKNYLIELGGELLAKGKNTDKNKNWTVAIDNPTQNENERTFIRFLELRDNRAMATSGNYRKFSEDSLTGQKFVHSINPLTGWPKVSNVLSASVLASTCMVADAYATVFMVMDLEESIAFLSQHTELDAFIIYTDDSGTLQEWMTEGFKKVLVD